MDGDSTPDECYCCTVSARPMKKRKCYNLSGVSLMLIYWSSPHNKIYCYLFVSCFKSPCDIECWGIESNLCFSTDICRLRSLETWGTHWKQWIQMDSTWHQLRQWGTLAKTASSIAQRFIGFIAASVGCDPLVGAVCGQRWIRRNKSPAFGFHSGQQVGGWIAAMFCFGSIFFLQSSGRFLARSLFAN